MDWSEFNRSIKEGRFERVYLFTGPEELSKREALAALKRALLPAGLEALNEATLEGRSAREIIEACETMPVMCERRVVVVRDWAPLLSNKIKGLEDEVKRMLEWLRDPPESCMLVFWMGANEELDDRRKQAAFLKKLPADLKKLQEALRTPERWVNFEYLTGSMLAKWCNQRLKPSGKKLRRDALELLSQMAGQELTRISAELEKLAAYAGDAEEIGADAVRAVVTPTPEYRAYLMLDHLLRGQLKEASEIAGAMLSGGSNPVRLIALLTSQLRIDAHLKLALDGGGNLPQAAKALDIRPERAQAVYRSIRAIPAEALRERYLACVEADYAIKSGKLRDSAALEMLMLKIVMRRGATNPGRASSN